MGGPVMTKAAIPIAKTVVKKLGMNKSVLNVMKSMGPKYGKQH